jgi:beta-lactamase class C
VWIFMNHTAAPAPKPQKTVEIPQKKLPLQAVAVENPFLQQFLAEYQQQINSMMRASGTPGAAVAIVKDSSIIFLEPFGIREIGTNDSVNVETVFRLASVSKCFAPVLTGLLVEDNALHWDDKVVTYLPTFALKSPGATLQLNLKNVLSHTVGLPYHTYTNLIEDEATLPDMLYKLREVDVINTVGKVYSYQNVAYSLIGEVMHSATGKTYEQLMAERIFGPLGMEQASMSYEAIKKNKNVALPHLPSRKGTRTTRIYPTYYNVGPAGGVNASISDMARWMTALLGHRQDVVSDSVLHEVFTPFVKAPYKNRNFRKWKRPTTGSYYSLGWRIMNFKEDTLCYHGGYVNGYRSEIALNRKENIAICVLSNLPGPMIDNAIPEFFRIYDKHKEGIHAWKGKQELIVMNE